MYFLRLMKYSLSRKFCSLHISKRYVKTMQAWKAFEFGGPGVLQLNPTASVPVLTKCMDVLVKVHASSINPLDLRMLEGYGCTTFNFVRQLQTCTTYSSNFPFTPGRDFSGTVVHVGKKVQNLRCGDEVWGALSPWQEGSHSEYVLTSASTISKKPTTLNHIEAASFPYAALTAWSALSTFGGLSENNASGKKILIIGATGGIGTFTIQLLKAWGAEVSVICQSDALDLMLKLGADIVIDYKNPDFKNNLKEINGLDIIFDNIGREYPEVTSNLLKKWSNSKYITVVSPLLNNTDERGLVLGTLISAVQASLDTAMSLKDGRSFRWAYFIPNGCALKKIAKMIDQKQINPVIDKIYNFRSIPDAYVKCSLGHSRGKIVIDHAAQDEEGTTDWTKETKHQEFAI